MGLDRDLGISRGHQACQEHQGIQGHQGCQGHHHHCGCQQQQQLGQWQQRENWKLHLELIMSRWLLEKILQWKTLSWSTEIKAKIDRTTLWALNPRSSQAKNMSQKSILLCIYSHLNLKQVTTIKNGSHLNNSNI